MVSNEALRIIALAWSGKYEAVLINTMEPMRPGWLVAM
jgi:hypothetical protein